MERPKATPAFELIGPDEARSKKQSDRAVPWTVEAAYEQETPAETEARIDAWAMDLLTRFEQLLTAWKRQQGAASLGTQLDLSQAIVCATAATLAANIAWQRTVWAMAERGDYQDFDVPDFDARVAACRDAILAQLSQIAHAPVEDGERPA